MQKQNLKLAAIRLSSDNPPPVSFQMFDYLATYAYDIFNLLSLWYESFFSFFFLSLFGWVICCTIYEYIKSKKKDKSQRNGVMMAFSLISNWKSLVRLDRSPTDVDCIHAIKVITAFGLVLGHRLRRIQEFVLHRFHGETFFWASIRFAILTLNHSTDIFFTISGFLVARSCINSFAQYVQKYLT